MSAFATWQPRYAALGIATFPVRDKRPSIRGWQRIGVDGSSALVRKFPDADAFGFRCGPRSRITVVDVDSPDESVLREAMAIFGETPVIWRTGSGNFALTYRHRGEARRIRPIDGLPIDLLGSDLAVLPPSVSAKGKYEYIHGSVEDLSALPWARPLPGNDDRRPAVPTGRRNTTLFHLALEHAPYADDLEALIDVVHTRNLDCEVPLPDAEVIKIAASAWGYEQRGENLKTRGGAVVIPNTVIDLLIDHPDAWRLYGKLRRHHWGRHFALANAMGRGGHSDAGAAWDYRLHT